MAFNQKELIDVTKTARRVITLLVFALTIATQAEQPQTEAPIRLVAFLIDGSRIIGVPSIDSLPVRTSYAGMDLPLKHIATASISADHNIATFECVNGDRLTGVIGVDAIEVEALFGKVSIRTDQLLGLSFVAAVAEWPADLKTGMLLYYSFDKNGGASVRNLGISKRNRNGRVRGATWTANGKVGGAYEFDGQDDYIESNEHLLDLRSLSFTAWLYVDAVGSGTQTLFIEADRTPGKILMLSLNPGNQLAFRTKDNSVAGAHVPTRRWFHIAAVANDETKRKEIWIDGVKVCDASFGGGANIGAHHRLHLGCFDNGSPHRNFFKGKMDEVRFFTRALSGTEIRMLYASER